MLTPHRAGLTTGIFFALLHLVWAVLVFAGVAQMLLDFGLPLHFINIPFTMKPFDLSKAGMLIFLTFVVGYVLGCVFVLLARLFETKNQ
jgi:thiamine transporter ThiT